MLETVLGRLGLPFLMSMVAGALGKVDNPLAQNASKALDDTQKAMGAGAISPETSAEANRHLEAMAALSLKERSDVVAQINESLRTEVLSNDIYVRRMRPTFGYIMAFTWAAQMTAISYVIVFDTAKAPVVLGAIESLSAIWCIALSVMGLYVYKQSDEKRPIIQVLEPKDDIPQPMAARKAFNQ